MSTIDDIEFLTFTVPERVDMRDAIVRTLRILHAKPLDPNIYINVERVGMTDGRVRSTLIALARDIQPWADEAWEPTDPWLSDLIAKVAEGDAIRSWSWGNAKSPFEQFCVGYGADGSRESTGLVFGMPMQAMLPAPMEAFFVGTCNLMWGPTWSLHP